MIEKREKSEKQLNKERKQRYFDKKYAEAPIVKCACGCGKQMKNVDKYGREKRYLRGHGGRKYKDPTQYKREWNYRNREYRQKAKTERGRMLKKKLMKIFGNKCISCGYQFDGTNAAAFDFHHKTIEEFSFRLSSANLINYSWEKVIAEGKKCTMLCTNCHRVHHWYNNKLSDSPSAVKRRNRVFRLKEELLNIFGGKCKQCGLVYSKDNISVFDFHHVDISIKKFSINQNTLDNYSISSVRKEADKCILLCSRCHRIHHSKNYQ